MKIRTCLTRNCMQRRSGSARQKGVTMVEFAIISPAAILLVLGIIQLGLMLSAKEIVNEAAFLAARAGAANNAQSSAMTEALQRALIPFYQNSTIDDGVTRLAAAYASELLDPGWAQVQVLNPTAAAFEDFGVTGSAPQGGIFIPNDNLEYRQHNVIGSQSGETIQDANALKIKVTYGYQIKVPLMASVIGTVMCGVGSDDCKNFYSQGRIPIVTYATVQMQTPALQPQD